MATWLIQDTELKEDGTEKGFQRLNVTRNRDTDLKKKPIVFVDDDGVTHNDINNFNAAKRANLITDDTERLSTRGGSPLTPEGMIEYTITLPPLAFTYFDIAKSASFTKEDETDFDHWVLGCIQSRFVHEYGFELVLRPVADKKDKDMETTMRQIVQEEIAKKAKVAEGEIQSVVTQGVSQQEVAKKAKAGKPAVSQTVTQEEVANK
jgi:hypothetical protein